MTDRHSERVPERDKNLDPLRPVLVLRAPVEFPDKDGIQPSNSKSSIAETPEFWMALHDAGYRPEDVVEKVMSRFYRTAFRRPRNIPWKLLPLIDSGAVDYYVERQTVFRSVPAAANLPAADSEFSLAHTMRLSRNAANAARLVVLDIPAADEAHLRQHTSVFDHIEADRLPCFAVWEGRNLVHVATETILDLRSKYEAQERFEASHILNASILFGRALLDLGDRLHLPRNWLSLLGLIDPLQFPAVASPLGLQSLFELARRGILGGAPARHPTPREPDYDQKSKAFENALLDGTGHRSIMDGGGHAFVWVGSRKYQPLVISDGFQLDQLKSMLYLQNQCGLISLLEDGRLSITKRGMMFLEYIGRDGDDPDVLLRWRADGVNGRQDDIPAMDRWLNRFFRATKRKVSSLQPWGLVEDGGRIDAGLGTERYVVGGRLDLTEADAETPEIMAFLDGLESSTHGLPWWKSNVGIVRDRRLAGGSPQVAIWYGIPQGTYPMYAKKMPRQETEEVLSDAAKVRDALPEWLRRRLPVKPAFVPCGMSCERSYSLYEADDAFVKPLPENRQLVMRGWHLHIPDPDLLGPEDRKLLGQIATCETERPERAGNGMTIVRLAKSDRGFHLVIGIFLWAEGWMRSYGFGDKSAVHKQTLAANIRERYGSLLCHPDIEGLATWMMDDRACEPVARVDWSYDGIENLDALLLQESHPNEPYFL